MASEVGGVTEGSNGAGLGDLGAGNAVVSAGAGSGVSGTLEAVVTTGAYRAEVLRLGAGKGSVVTGRARGLLGAGAAEGAVVTRVALTRHVGKSIGTAVHTLSAGLAVRDGWASNIGVEGSGVTRSRSDNGTGAEVSDWAGIVLHGGDALGTSGAVKTSRALKDTTHCIITSTLMGAVVPYSTLEANSRLGRAVETGSTGGRVHGLDGAAVSSRALKAHTGVLVTRGSTGVGQVVGSEGSGRAGGHGDSSGITVESGLARKAILLRDLSSVGVVGTSLASSLIHLETSSRAVVTASTEAGGG